MKERIKEITLSELIEKYGGDNAVYICSFFLGEGDPDGFISKTMKSEHSSGKFLSRYIKQELNKRLYP